MGRKKTPPNELPTTSELERLLTSLDAYEAAYLRHLLNPEVPWLPQEGPQSEALLSPADETFYGGSAGGGKSDLGLGLAILLHERSVMFRRHYTDLSWLQDRSRQLLAGRAAFNGQSRSWRFAASPEKVLTFGALQYADDWEKWQGRPYDLYVFDEGTQFPLTVIQTLTAWNRSTTPGQRCRVIVTFNPPTTQEGEWVLDYLAPWLDPKHPHPAQPGEIRWYSMVDGECVPAENGDPFDHNGETITPRSRTFIPARLEDNKFFGPEYRARLQNLPEPLRSQLLFGDMNIGRRDDAWQVIPTQWVLAAFERWKAGPPRRTNGEIAPLSGIGVDVARGGDDRTIIVKAHGRWIDRLIAHDGTDTPDGEAIVRLLRREWDEQAPICIDVIGVGSSPYDLGRREGMRMYAVNNAAATKARAQGGAFGFTNVRAELYWRLREALDPNGPYRFALPDDRELLAELTAPRWEPTSRGVKIEPKKAIAERLGRSPDKADAVALLVRAMRMSNM
jgi:hypothetical protein